MKQPVCFIPFFVKNRDTIFWDLPAEYRNNFFQSWHLVVLKINLAAPSYTIRALKAAF